MMYALVRDGVVVSYPYTIARFRKDNPDTSFSRNPPLSLLAEFNVYPVAAVTKPVPALTENVIEGSPVPFNGEWTQSWATVPASPGQIAERQEEVRDAADRAAVKADSFVSSFTGMSPNQVIEYISNNGTTLAALRVVVTKLALIVLILARRGFKE